MMTEYTTNSTLAEMAQRFRAAQRIALSTHSKPDGDAIGSVVALARAGRSLGKRCEIFLMGPVASNLIVLMGEERFVEIEDEQRPDGEFDLIVIADTGASSQLEPLTPWVRERLDRTMIFDHHVNGDLEAAMRLVAPECASATLVILDFLKELGVKPDGGPCGIAEALFLGLATDTGWFQYSNADARAFRAAAELIDAGADKSRIYRIIQENDRPERLALKARLLQSLELVADGQAAVMTLEADDFGETGAIIEDTVALVNEPLTIASVRVVAMLTSLEPGRTKVSLRSKPPLVTEHGVIAEIDVNRLAQRFGGGGHVHAAGAKIDLPLPEAHQIIIEALEETCGVKA